MTYHWENIKQIIIEGLREQWSNVHIKPETRSHSEGHKEVYVNRTMGPHAWGINIHWSVPFEAFFFAYKITFLIFANSRADCSHFERLWKLNQDQALELYQHFVCFKIFRLLTDTQLLNMPHNVRAGLLWVNGLYTECFLSSLPCASMITSHLFREDTFWIPTYSFTVYFLL